jgi:FAD/FMN-containing dehydrogenase
MTEKFWSIGRLITPKEPGYDQACQEWNARLPTHPKGIVYCQNAQDVSAALQSAVRRGLPFRARCGGHSYECFSMIDDGLVIDVTDLSTISVNQDSTVAVIGSGARLSDVYSKLWQVGVTIPGGTCPPVGISGLTLGGGLGMLVRSRGLLIDSLLAVEMVDAKGNILTADSSSNPDLFWASRGGGGGNFGIVTSLTFQVAPIADVTVFAITWKWSDLAAALDAWQQWALGCDERISVLFVLLPQAAEVVTSFGEFVGTSEELRPLLEPLLSATQPTQISIQTMPYIQAVNTIATLEGDASTTTSNRVKGNTGFMSELFDTQAIQTLEEWMAKAPGGAAPVIYALGGAISRVAPDETAFVHRNAMMLITFQSNWTNSADDNVNVEWVEGIHQAMQTYTTGGAYVNIPDRALENWPYAYYGDNFPRLMEVKRRYDPDNVFNFEQSVPVSLTPDDARKLKLPESMIAGFVT